MKASLRWLEELLGTKLDPAQVRDRLAMLSAPVDSMETTHAALGAIVVGLVLEAERHPNADRLTLCRVDDGDGAPKSVVCGAPNVTAGRKYPFARVGVTLPGGLVLERRKIRGETSEGMLCSARELGLGEEHEGILELVTDAPPGTPLLRVLDVADTRYELDITANRPDLLCHEGIARDLGAVLGRPVKLPALPGAPEPPRIVRAKSASGEVDGAAVTIEDVEGCPRYAAAVIRGVKVGPSPAWLRERLAAVGSRSINNVVDATNYLMLENGQPLHAFDLAKLRGGAIVVRRARPGEKLVTLDGVERHLSPEMTLICDAERAVAIAGVMGGLDSEVTASTTDILLECAWFEPKRIRRTRRELGMSTDASYRFERGVDQEATAARLARAAQLIAAVAGGRITGAVDVYPAPAQPRTVFLRDARITQVLGVEVPRAEVERVLTAIGCVVGPREDRYAVQVPAWRPDLEREIDLVEEVARVVGYDRFPDEVRAYRPGTVPDAPSEVLGDRLRTALAAMGLHEAVTLPLGPKRDEEQVAVLNPLSQEEAWLRSDLLTGLTRRVEYNWRHLVRDVRLFEIGHVFARHGGRTEYAGGRSYDLPLEEEHVAGVLTGARRPAHWLEPHPPDF
ncbi:MAG TPA: phenylalanine--tRNA ligase subunit beta, partial [Gemmatimonadales bacterium]|nr:phenylalanine--tRNA ligase subunit beta [Gemmatimonadales bacterium]